MLVFLNARSLRLLTGLSSPPLTINGFSLEFNMNGPTTLMNIASTISGVLICAERRRREVN